MVTDQAQSVADDHVVLRAEQTVRVGTPGLLSRVDVRLNAYNSGAGISGDFQIFRGTMAQGTPLLTVPFAFSPDTPAGYLPFNLPPQVVFVPGEYFTLLVAGAGGANLDAYFSTTNTYPDGAGPFGGDLVFRTNMVAGGPDQEQLVSTDHGVVNAEQSITAGRNGLLVLVEMRLNTFNGGAGINGNFAVYRGDTAVGAPVASSTYAFGPAVLGTQMMAVNPPVQLSAGEVFTIRAENSGALTDVYFASGDPYPGGVGAFAGHDLVFRTHMITCP